MKLKSLTLILAVALGAQAAFAQVSKSDASVEFRPHWYGQIQGGAAYTVGETVWKDLISPAGAVSLGYQFNPALGLRFGLGGWQGKGNSLPLEVYKFNFLQGNVDLTVNLANLFGYTTSASSARMPLWAAPESSLSRMAPRMSKPFLPRISSICGMKR